MRLLPRRDRTRNLNYHCRELPHRSYLYHGDRSFTLATHDLSDTLLLFVPWVALLFHRATTLSWGLLLFMALLFLAGLYLAWGLFLFVLFDWLPPLLSQPMGWELEGTVESSSLLPIFHCIAPAAISYLTFSHLVTARESEGLHGIKQPK